MGLLGGPQGSGVGGRLGPQGWGAQAGCVPALLLASSPPEVSLSWAAPRREALLASPGLHSEGLSAMESVHRPNPRVTE